MKYRTFILACLLPLASCGAVNYKYYVLDRSGNKLLGVSESGADDLPLDKTCDPDSKDKAKCIVMLTEEFFKAKKETLELREALKACQKGTAPQ